MYNLDECVCGHSYSECALKSTRKTLSLKLKEGDDDHPKCFCKKRRELGKRNTAQGVEAEAACLQDCREVQGSRRKRLEEPTGQFSSLGSHNTMCD